MKKFVISAILAASVSVSAIAYAQATDPVMEGVRATTAHASEASALDARSLASDHAVGEARRYYRAQCSRHESAAFCECVTAGVAQALMPDEVRVAARTIGQRITAQGDAPAAAQSDASAALSSAERIEQVEGHYADACVQFRR